MSVGHCGLLKITLQWPPCQWPRSVFQMTLGQVEEAAAVQRTCLTPWVPFAWTLGFEFSLGTGLDAYD